jgi:hypothetical protein
VYEALSYAQVYCAPAGLSHLPLPGFSPDGGGARHLYALWWAGAAAQRGWCVRGRCWGCVGSVVSDWSGLLCAVFVCCGSSAQRAAAHARRYICEALRYWCIGP